MVSQGDCMLLLFVATLGTVGNVQFNVSMIRIEQHRRRLHCSLIFRCILDCYNGPAVEVITTQSSGLIRNRDHGFI